MGIVIRGGPELAGALEGLMDTREVDAAKGVAGRTVQDAVLERVPSDSGDLAASIEFTEDDRSVTIGSNSPYARWFHVPTLSEGGVTYAKKESRRGRSYGQRIPDDPFIIDAIESVEDDVVDAYATAVGDLVDRALGGK